MTARTIDPQHAADLFELDDVGQLAGPWEFVAKQRIASSRWRESYWLIVRDADGATFGIRYAVGLTENQYSELPWEDADVPLPLTRLHPHTVTTVEYRTEAS